MQTLLQNKFVTHKLTERWSSSSSSSNNNIHTTTTSNTTTDDPMTMTQFTANDETNKWTTFANDDLAPVVYPNICRSLSESYAAFGYVDHVASFSMTQKLLVKNVGALAMYFAASRIKGTFFVWLLFFGLVFFCDFGVYSVFLCHFENGTRLSINTSPVFFNYFAYVKLTASTYHSYNTHQRNEI